MNMKTKTLLDYTIFCTEEQARKALELGAQLKTYTADGYVESGCAECPTAEQMIGWLEDEVFREVNIQYFGNYWEYNLYTSSEDLVSHKGNFRSRQEATFAAIDAALEYLTNNNKTNNIKL